MASKVALITGGTGEIGRAICERLGRNGCRTAAMDLTANSVDARAWQETSSESGIHVTLIEADVTNMESCERAIREVELRVGPVDILVNCAGITRDSTLRKLDKDSWDAVLTTNLDSVFHVTKHVIDGMITRGYGRIINISSLNGIKGQFGQCNYSAAKAGMHGFTMALAQEVARKGVTVNTVSPGYIETSMVGQVPAGVLNEIVNQIPVGRLGKPEEISAIVNFLASDEAAFVTGANISVNGGQHMH